MEDALVLAMVVATIKTAVIVLILVLMEDALVRNLLSSSAAVRLS